MSFVGGNEDYDERATQILVISKTSYIEYFTRIDSLHREIEIEKERKREREREREREFFYIRLH